jgi:hypothetical protein
MVLHESKLWLSPEVFGKLSEERLGELRKLGVREVSFIYFVLGLSMGIQVANTRTMLILRLG